MTENIMLGKPEELAEKLRWRSVNEKPSADDLVTGKYAKRPGTTIRDILALHKKIQCDALRLRQNYDEACVG